MYGIAMPWGKWKGHELSAIPVDYLLWCLQKCDNLQPWLANAIARDLRGRGVVLEIDPHEECPLCQRSGYGAEPRRELPYVREVVESWFRRQTLRHHPDRGGSTAVQAALNAAREELLAAMGDER